MALEGSPGTLLCSAGRVEGQPTPSTHAGYHLVTLQGEGGGTWGKVRAGKVIFQVPAKFPTLFWGLHTNFPMHILDVTIQQPPLQRCQLVSRLVKNQVGNLRKMTTNP